MIPMKVKYADGERERLGDYLLFENLNCYAVDIPESCLSLDFSDFWQMLTFVSDSMLVMWNRFLALSMFDLMSFSVYRKFWSTCSQVVCWLLEQTSYEMGNWRSMIFSVVSLLIITHLNFCIFFFLSLYFAPIIWELITLSVVEKFLTCNTL